MPEKNYAKALVKKHTKINLYAQFLKELYSLLGELHLSATIIKASKLREKKYFNGKLGEIESLSCEIDKAAAEALENLKVEAAEDLPRFKKMINAHVKNIKKKLTKVYAEMGEIFTDSETSKNENLSVSSLFQKKSNLSFNEKGEEDFFKETLPTEDDDQVLFSENETAFQEYNEKMTTYNQKYKEINLYLEKMISCLTDTPMPSLLDRKLFDDTQTKINQLCVELEKLPLEIMEKLKKVDSSEVSLELVVTILKKNTEDLEGELLAVQEEINKLWGSLDETEFLKNDNNNNKEDDEVLFSDKETDFQLQLEYKEKIKIYNKKYEEVNLYLEQMISYLTDTSMPSSFNRQLFDEDQKKINQLCVELEKIPVEILEISGKLDSSGASLVSVAEALKVKNECLNEKIDDVQEVINMKWDSLYSLSESEDSINDPLFSGINLSFNSMTTDSDSDDSRLGSPKSAINIDSSLSKSNGKPPGISEDPSRKIIRLPDAAQYGRAWQFIEKRRGDRVDPAKPADNNLESGKVSFKRNS